MFWGGRGGKVGAKFNREADNHRMGDLRLMYISEEKYICIEIGAGQ